MKHVQFGLNNAKIKCWRRKCNMCHVRKLTFKFLAQNMRRYESWWFLLTSAHGTRRAEIRQLTVIAT